MRINFLGDSITAGASAETLDGRYSSLVAKAFGAEEYNFGIGGTRIARQAEIKDYVDDKHFLTRAIQMPTDADFTFVFGGTNDYGHGDAKLGVFEDTNPYTFYGAMRELTAYMVGRFPKNKLCFILPIHRYGEDNPYGDGRKEEAGAPLSVYVEAEKKVLDEYGVEYLDLSDRFYIPTVNTDDGNLYKDGLHPNAKGHKVLAECLIEYLKNKGF